MRAIEAWCVLEVLPVSPLAHYTAKGQHVRKSKVRECGMRVCRALCSRARAAELTRLRRHDQERCGPLTLRDHREAGGVAGGFLCGRDDTGGQSDQIHRSMHHGQVHVGAFALPVRAATHSVRWVGLLFISEKLAQQGYTMRSSRSRTPVGIYDEYGE